MTDIETTEIQEIWESKYDPDADALYISVSAGKVASTSPTAIPELYIDLDDEGKLLGVEILNFKKRFTGE
jgi:uncharacterized protein YuzE